jgi:hypothetical protein
MLERTMFASAQPVLNRAAVPILAAAGFLGEGCRIGCRHATGSASFERFSNSRALFSGVQGGFFLRKSHLSASFRR